MDWLLPLVYYCVFAVLPRLDSVIDMSSASQTSLTVRFAAWSSSNGGEETPVRYKVQLRVNDNETWVPRFQLEHKGATEFTVELKYLEPDTLYYVNVIPYIDEGGMSYAGFPKEGGPFRTLSYGK